MGRMARKSRVRSAWRIPSGVSGGFSRAPSSRAGLARFAAVAPCLKRYKIVVRMPHLLTVPSVSPVLGQMRRQACRLDQAPRIGDALAGDVVSGAVGDAR